MLGTINQWDLKRTGDPYYAGRWPYIEAACEWARGCDGPVLEIGARGLPIVPGADTLDVDPQWQPTYLHDAAKTPWPIDNRQYGLVVALQVWEHLAGRQANAFGEVMRVARRAILSFPYRWNNPPDHADIGLRRIIEWTWGADPIAARTIPSSSPTCRKDRLLVLYDFDALKPLR